HLRRRPYRQRSPCRCALVPKPCEICLAHHDILFSDELPESKREALGVMHQSLEDGSVTIARGPSRGRNPSSPRASPNAERGRGGMLAYGVTTSIAIRG